MCRNIFRGRQVPVSSPWSTSQNRHPALRQALARPVSPSSRIFCATHSATWPSVSTASARRRCLTGRPRTSSTSRSPCTTSITHASCRLRATRRDGDRNCHKPRVARRPERPFGLGEALLPPSCVLAAHAPARPRNGATQLSVRLPIPRLSPPLTPTAAAYAQVKLALTRLHPYGAAAYYEVKDPVCDVVMDAAERSATDVA